jgi:multiple sugar transport system permease protein
MKSYRLIRILSNAAVYAVLTFFALVMLFPFGVMLSTALKEPADTFSYPPRLLPGDAVTITISGYDAPLPLYLLEVAGAERQMALVKEGVKVGVYAPPADLSAEVISEKRLVKPSGGVTQQKTVEIAGETKKLFNVTTPDGQVVEMVLVRETALGEFVDPTDPNITTLANVRLSQPVRKLAWHPENFSQVMELQGLDRALTNTTLVTLLVVFGQLATSVVGGYAFARLRFPGRNQLFVLYLGTIMIPFVVLIVPLYQLMVQIGWQDRLAALIFPWVFSAYGTFLMRQFFLSIPKEIEEAALIDGASRLQILWRIFIPASVPALATQATFTFLYAWNSFIWPLLIINTGNSKNHVLTLALSILRGRASDSPNIVLAGAAIAVIPPLIVFILAQRYYVENVASSGVKG